MKNIKIFCLDNSELMSFDSANRGFRSDIFVNIDKLFYQLNIYDIVRLTQDFECELDSYGFFSIEANIVVVKEVVFDEIIKTILSLCEHNYFDKIKQLNSEEILKLSLIQIY